MPLILGVRWGTPKVFGLNSESMWTSFRVGTGRSHLAGCLSVLLVDAKMFNKAEMTTF